MKKGFASLLTALVAVSASTLINTTAAGAQGASNVSELTDVVGNEWAYNALKELVNNPCHILSAIRTALIAGKSRRQGLNWLLLFTNTSSASRNV